MLTDISQIILPANALVDQLQLNVYNLVISDVSRSHFSVLVASLLDSGYKCNGKPSSNYAKLNLPKSTPVTGFCWLRFKPSPSSSQPHINISWQLILNPTRTLRNTLPPSSFRREYSLDGSKNWLPLAWVKEQDMQQVRSLMANAIDNELHNMLSVFFESLGSIGVDVDTQVTGPGISVSKIEAYHQFPCSDPIGFVLELDDPFSRLFHTHDKAIYPVIIPGWTRNSPCLRGKFKAGLDIKVYAKTDRAVRIEFTAEKDRIRNLREPKTNTVQYPIGWPVMDVAVDVAAEGYRCLRPLFDWSHCDVNIRDPLEFMYIIARACPKVGIFRVVIGSLAHAGAISTERPLYTCIPRLCMKGILEKTTTRGRYRLNPGLEWVRPLLVGLMRKWCDGSGR